MQNISEQFKSVTTHGSESQIFMFIHNMKNELNCQANDFEDLLLSQKGVSLSFIESDSLSFIKSFGSVEMKEASFDIKYKPFKGQQAQNLQQKRKIPTQFKLDVKFKAAGAIIAGIGVTKDNRLFLCNTASSNLYVMSDKGQQLATIQMDGPQWGIAMEEEANSAWVTLLDKHSVQAVDVVTMRKKGQLIKSPGRCHGIALIDDQIAVGSYGRIYIMCKTGEIKKTLDVGGSEVHSISVGQKNQLYYAQGNIGKSTLKSVGLDGLVTSISAENVNYLIGVKLDRIGNAYLLECAAAHFKIYSFEDKSIKTFLTKNEGLNNPYGFAFSNDFSKLCISNCNTKEILVFQCT
ncbi:uncharacterized protein [Mytilus edulis]|uniref:uncharacterized protein n=1 Tax=Mytilus edulis TaxID=6550 RepID=UPI0039F11A92